MNHDEFVAEVQERGRLDSTREAERAIEATLETLGKRLAGGAPHNLADQLPDEIGRHLRVSDAEPTKLSLDEFFEQVSMRGGADLPAATHQARSVIAVLQDAVSEGEIEKLRQQLPGEYDPLFESGSEGQMDRG